MNTSIGTGFVGSSAIQTSTANQELVAGKPFYRMSFLNKADCTIKINGGDPIFLEEEQGFDSSERDVSIESFIVVTEGIQFNYIAAY